jgi:hypothetical protein
MKKTILTIVLVATSLISSGQHFENISFEQTQNSDIFQKVRNGTTVTKYVTRDGLEIKVGDTLYLGYPLSNQSRTVTDGTNFGTSSYGKAVSRTTSRKTYTSIIYGKPGGFGNVMLAMNGDSPTGVGSEMRGTAILIKEMKLMHRGSKKKPLGVSVLFGEINGRAFGMNKYLSCSDIESSIIDGEIIPANMPMNREEAIAKLKEAKDLMDLDMMTKDEFDALKEELSPVIMKN